MARATTRTHRSNLSANIAVENFTHKRARRRNVPTAEHQAFFEQQPAAAPIPVRYPRDTPLAEGERRERNVDLDPQLVWRGKDEQDWSDLVVHAPPLYVQEKVHPKAIIDDLHRQSRLRREAGGDAPDLFADFNGLPDHEAKLEFYAHEQNWANRMILGDSLQVMASLAEREGLRGKVQCIYIDPPYGIRFNSNWQVSTRSRDVKDGSADHISREPEQIKAFRDTWNGGMSSYLIYLRDRLRVARELLQQDGSIFVQIGDDNVHRVRSIMDEIFGDANCVAMIYFQTAANQNTNRLQRLFDCLLWYTNTDHILVRHLFESRLKTEIDQIFTHFDEMRREKFKPSQIKAPCDRVRLEKAGRCFGKYWKRMLSDFPYVRLDNVWTGTIESTFSKDKIYVVQTNRNVVDRCILMASDPGDLVLDPTCGSGTTATVAEQWGRRWITIDTSRVALALARARIMAARYPYYMLADSEQGREKEAEVSGRPSAEGPDTGDLRQGFVYERVPHITLKAIANNAEIDAIWEQRQPAVEQALAELNAALRGHDAPFRVKAGGRAGQDVDFRAPAGSTVKLPSGEDAPANGLLEWEVPREVPRDVPEDWPAAARKPFDAFWQARIERQQEIDASIARNADVEFLYDRPYPDKRKVRVAGPFTVESLSPHRIVAADDSELGDDLEASEGVRKKSRLPYARDGEADFAEVVIEHLKTAGVQRAKKADRITFTSVTPWPGTWIGAEGRFTEINGAEVEKRAAIFIGPEYGTLTRPDLVAAAREAQEAGFHVLIACAFAYDAHSSAFTKLGPMPVLRARMNPDLHMADALKNTGSGNLFVVFGEPDIEVRATDGDQIEVRVLGVDVFDTASGEVRSGGIDDIAAWFIDTDYDEESFFVRHAYFLGAHDPYKALKTTLKAEIDETAWNSLYCDTSRPFPKPSRGRFAVKVINHFGDEVMKVFRVN